MSKLTILMVSIIIAVAVVLGYVSFIKPKTSAPVQPTPSPTITPIVTSTPEPTSIATPSPTTTPSPTSDNTSAPTSTPDDISKTDMSDWKTYRNEKFGFEIKYPLEFSSWEASYSQEKAEIMDIGFRPKDLQGSVLVITVLDIPLQELSKYEHSLYGDPTNEKIKIGDLDGIKFSGYRPRMTGIQKGKYTFFFKSLNWREEKDLEYFDRMLSTFKFDKS